MTNKLSAVEYHQELAADWDDRYCSGSFKRRADLFCGSLLPLAPPGGVWLDAGCGSGYFSRILAQRQSEVIGLDASKNMINDARCRAAQAGIENRISFREIETVEALPFARSSFDGCICLSVLEYLPDPFACIDEIVRVLKPGGFLIISTPHKWSALRGAQKLLRAVSWRKQHESIDYLESSHYSTTGTELRFKLDKRGLKTVRIAGFDALFPTWMHSLLAPGLIYTVAQRLPYHGKQASSTAAQ